MPCHSPTGLSSRFDRRLCPAEARADFTRRVSDLYVLRGYDASYRKLQKSSQSTAGLKRFFLILASLVLLAALALGAYFLAWPTIWWKQKMTVTVATPEGEVSGSSIVRSLVSYEPHFLQDTGYFHYSWRGEAVTVVLPDGRYLFVLLGHPPSMAEAVFKDSLPEHWSKANDHGRSYFRKLSSLRESRAVPPETFPVFVTFTDPANPATVARVDPGDLAASFGHGYRLKSVMLEITDAPVTKGEVEKALGWIGEYPETPVLTKIDPHDFSFAAKLRQGSFIQR